MEVSQQIIQVLDAISDKFGLAVDWSQNNILPYIQQLGERVVKYEISTSIVWIVIGLLSLILGVGMIIYDIKHNGDQWFSFVIFGGALVIISITAIVSQIFDIVTCYTFPEKIWLEYIQNYMPK